MVRANSAETGSRIKHSMTEDRAEHISQAADAAPDPEDAGVEGAVRPVKVLFPLPLSQAYDYLPPPGEKLTPGMWVRAPLGPREVLGVVWSENAPAKPVDPAKLKQIVEVMAAPPLQGAGN